MKKQMLDHASKANAGIAYDELALVAAMVASVGAFAAIALPWEKMGVGNGSSTQVMIDQLAIIENANLAFHDRYRLWPHQVTDGNATRNVAVLSDQSAMKFPYSAMRNFEQLLPVEKFEMNPQEKVMYHTIGDGGQVTQEVVFDAGERFMEVTFENVPLVTARKIDEKIDGYYDPELGRVSMTFQDSIVDTDTVSLHYRANRI